jgi:hypothetical protein
MKIKIALAAAIIATGSANAATITTSFGNSIPLAVTEINQTGSLNFFNSALGTLTGAVLTITDAFSSDVTFKNAAAQAQTFKAATTLDLILSSTLSPLNTIIQNAAPATATFAIPTSTLAAGATSQTYISGTINGTPGTLNLSSILASLIGTSSFDVNCRSFTPTSVTQVGGNITSTQNTQAGCGASIVYTYNAVVTPPAGVPVPASVALLGLGLLAAGAVSRRKA